MPRLEIEPYNRLFAAQEVNENPREVAESIVATPSILLIPGVPVYITSDHVPLLGHGTFYTVIWDQEDKIRIIRTPDFGENAVNPPNLAHNINDQPLKVGQTIYLISDTELTKKQTPPGPLRRTLGQIVKSVKSVGYLMSNQHPPLNVPPPSDPPIYAGLVSVKPDRPREFGVEVPPDLVGAM